MSRCRAFSLVELLVVVAIVAVISALLIPGLAQSRAHAVRVLCANNMHQQAIMTSQYVADGKGFLPCPSTNHRLTYNTLGPISSGTIGVYPQTSLVMYTRNDPSGSLLALNNGPCPDTDNGSGGSGARSMPVGFGWFYYMGYLGATVKRARNIAPGLECPGTPKVRYSSGYIYGQTPMEYSEVNYGETSAYTKLFASRDIFNPGNNPAGVNNTVCCVARSATEYMNRGWFLTSSTKPVGRVEKWKPGNAWVVDSESYLGGPTTSEDAWNTKHKEKINIQFIDGHVSYGARYLTLSATGESVPPAVYYSATISGRTSATAWNCSTGITGNGSTYNFTDASVSSLWGYYESGN